MTINTNGIQMVLSLAESVPIDGDFGGLVNLTCLCLLPAVLKYRVEILGAWVVSGAGGNFPPTGAEREEQWTIRLSWSLLLLLLSMLLVMVDDG